MSVFGFPDDISPEGPVSALHAGVRVPEVRAGVRGQNAVSERGAQRDRALCDQRGTVHVGSPALVVPVPMDSRSLGHQRVGKVDDQGVSLADLEQIKQNARLVDCHNNNN